MVTPHSLTHGEQQLLYRLDENQTSIAKNSPACLYVFEDGKLTYRSNYSTQLGEAVDMSNEEIIDKYKKGDEECKEAARATCA